jgi:hypothetical protein
VRRDLWCDPAYRAKRDATMRCVYCGAYRSNAVKLEKDGIGATVCVEDDACERRVRAIMAILDSAG